MVEQELTKELMEEFEKELAENLTKKLERILGKVLENYVLNPDIHNLAYEINDEYKLFYDNLPEYIKVKQKQLKPLFIAQKVTHAPYHIATFGLTKLLEKSPKKIVNSTDFTETMRLLNTVLKNY